MHVIFAGSVKLNEQSMVVLSAENSLCAIFSTVLLQIMIELDSIWQVQSQRHMHAHVNIQQSNIK